MNVANSESEILIIFLLTFYKWRNDLTERQNRKQINLEEKIATWKENWKKYCTEYEPVPKEELQKLLDQLDGNTSTALQVLAFPCAPSSTDGVVVLGGKLGAFAKLENPLLYAPSLKSMTSAKDFLRTLLEQLIELSN